MSIPRVNIAFAGLTAAGKTTHARLLADHLGYEYVSATQIMLEILGIATQDTKRVWFHHMDEIEQARSGDRIDQELERRLLELALAKEGLVLDTWAMAWICPDPIIRIWIDSDRLSRHWKCFVSQGQPPKLALPGCATLIDRKDESTRDSFLRRHNFDLFADHAMFDAVLTNTHLISEPSPVATEEGIRLFAPVVQLVADHLLGRVPWSEVQATLQGADPRQARSVLHLKTAG
ncbi:cytidylate kinase family protein [Streptomyces chryseus]|uniref:Cytidylate kinase n=1 Tax=Streptomyces chryseus TaxID=68186 RepID=A0ABQ3EBK3_9ACTN|nr:cytidylate kinase family protein [Streptomyces chryseus]GHB28748.1 hypothetical protein GCM10010346_60360 [Streptomyces chryseus]